MVWLRNHGRFDGERYFVEMNNILKIFHWVEIHIKI